MQPVPCTGWRSLLKLGAHRFKFLEPSFSSKIIDVLDERFPRRQKRVLVTLFVTVVPSMSEKDIEIKVFFSARVLRAKTQTVKLTRVEKRYSMVSSCLVEQAIEELFRQTPRLKLITLQRRTFAGTTIFIVTMARTIVNALVGRRTS